MKLAYVLAELVAEDALELLAPHWEESEASTPASGPSFLDPAELTASREFLDLPKEMDELLLVAARRVRETPALLCLAWHCYRLLFEHHDYPGDRIAQWPSFEKRVPGMSGAFYLLIALGVVPLTRTVHRERGIPESITRHSLRDFHEQTDLYRPTSNMVLWQRELYLFPWSSNGKAGLFSIFGEDEIDPASAPRDTSLRRAVLDHLAAGRPLRNGAMFMLREDFQHFGTQHYRRHWAG